MALDGSGPGGRRLSARLCAVGVAVAALATGGGLLAGSVPAGTTTPGVGGRVYVDVDTNGERGPDEPGLAGVTVAAFADDNEFVASTVTDVQGSWALAVDRAVRIEVDPRSGEGERWAVESVAWGMPAVGVAVPGDLDHDVALMDPARVCGDDPKVVMSCFFASAASTDAPAVRTFDESDGVPEVGDQRVTGRDERWIDATSAAEHQEVGSVYGAATDSDSGSAYVSAYAKRFTPIGPLGINGIYRIDAGGAVVPFFSSLTPAQPARTIDPSNIWADPWGAWQIGWIGWGDIDVIDGRLYGVNLGDRHLYVWSLLPDGSADGPPSRISIPLQGPDALSDRPFGLGSWRGMVYVGGVDTGDRAGTPVVPSGWVQRFDPETMTFPDGAGRAAVTFPLGYTRGCVYRVYVGCGLLDLRVRWRRWGSAPDVRTDFDPAYRRQYDFEVNPQPMVADLEFDDDGALIVGLRDRWGDLLARNVPVGTVPNPWFGALGPTFERYLDGYAFGDVVRFDREGDRWVMENNGAASGAVGSAGSGAGPGGGEFYDADHALIHADLYDGLGRAIQGHDETAVGSLALKPGSGEVLVSSYDVFGAFDTLGVRWLSRDGGDNPDGRAWTVERNNRAAIAQRDPVSQNSESPFGKTNGLGDIELLCGTAPRVIGDLVWFDTNRNGIQDPPGDGGGERGLAGVALQLSDASGTVIAVTETDANGRYRFVVERGRTYDVEIAPWEFISGELQGMGLTVADAPDRGGADSDAVMAGDRARLVAQGPESGGARLTFDIGLVRLEDPPPPTTTMPPPTGGSTTTAVAPPPTTPGTDLDGGNRARPGDDLSSGRTSTFLASSGGRIFAMFVLAIGLLILGVILVGSQHVERAGGARRDMESG